MAYSKKSSPSQWVADTVESSHGVVAWLETPLSSTTRPVSAHDAASACELLAASMRLGQSWSVAMLGLSRLGPKNLRKYFTAAGADLARGVGIPTVAAALPIEIGAQIALAASAPDPAAVLDKAAASLRAHAAFTSSVRRWMPVAALAALLVAALSWLVGGVLVPALTSLVSEGYLSWTARLAPYLSFLLATLAVGVILVAAVLFVRLGRSRPPALGAHLLSLPGLDVSWAARMALAARLDPILSSPAHDVAAGMSIEQALSTTLYSPVSEMIRAGSLPEEAFGLYAEGLDRARASRARAVPLFVLWAAVAFAAVVLISTVLTVIVPLVQLVVG